MKRGILFLALVFLGFSPFHFAQAQQTKKVPQIGYLSPFDPATESAPAEAIRLALRELGYIEGQNIAIEYRYAEGKLDRLPELAAELVRLKLDIIVVSGGGQTGPGGHECDQDDSHRYGGAFRPILSRQAWLTALPVPAATSPAFQAFPEN
jgi:hypothetical protein